MLSHGGRFLGTQAGLAVVVDLMWVALFAAYLMTARRLAAADVTMSRTIETA